MKEEFQVKIGGFDIATKLINDDNFATSTILGNPSYMAPEKIRGEQYN